jgi:hypothetical protein
VTLVPAGLGALVRVVGVLARARLDATRATVRAWVHGTRLGARFLRPAEVRRLVEGTELFARACDASLDAVVRVARVLPVRSGTVVFRQGDRDDTVYVVARGNAYILVGDGGEERVVDELPEGALFGEIACLSGDPRTATVRAAGATVLLAIDGATVRGLLDTDAALRERVWAHYGERTFENLVARVAAFDDLDRAARLALLREGEHVGLADGESLPRCEHELVFVMTGTVRVRKGDLSLLARAPMLVESETGLELAGVGPARVVRIARTDTLADVTL